MDEKKRKLVGYAVLGGVTLLLVISVGYNLLAGDPGDIKPVTAKSTDFILTWQCLACQHEADDYAVRGPKPCPNCGKEEFYASTLFNCAEHGVFRVAFNYDERGKPSEVKLAPDKPWVPYVDRAAGKLNVVCPVCGKSVIPAESPRTSLEEPAEATEGDPGSE
jgi:predicted RNA-binding Zn-ribbon protein involved in translation (DUF1610 family)